MPGAEHKSALLYSRVVLALGLAVAAFGLFLIGVLRDPRSFSNAVFLGLALALGTVGVAERLVNMPGRPERLLLLGLTFAVAVGPFLVACYLLVNGVMIARRESLRLAHLLPLAAGAGILWVIALDVTADRAGSPKLSLASTIAQLIFGYVSFLLVSYVMYAWVYGQVAGLLRSADFVIVLGAGLDRNGQVTSLLASRVDRGREVWEAISARSARGGDPGAGPVLIVSGGKGDDERVPEASAMAAYLVAQGFPADRIVREERSRTTEENLNFSKAIMDAARPNASCVIVTSNYHVFRTAILARHARIRGQVTGARTAGYYWPAAMLREFAAIFMRYRVVNLSICVLLALAPAALAAAGRF